MNSYQEYKSYLDGGRSKVDRPLCNNTRIRIDENGDIVIKQHATDIIRYRQDGSIVLDSGGWRTSTTKQRMNEYAPVHIFQERGIWYVDNKDTVFADGFTINPDGSYSGIGENPKKQIKLGKAITKFAHAYGKAFVAGEVPAPDNGDCMMCRFSWGGPDHLESHIEEKYYVPSLLVLAEKHTTGTLSMFTRDFIARTWNGDCDNPAGDMSDTARDQISACIRKYMRHELGLAS